MAESRAVVGVLLAAGAGRRMGGPKALIGPGYPAADKESPVSQVAGWMHAGGCAEVIVVIGARAAEVRASLPIRSWLNIVEATDWAHGMGASLRAGLTRARAGTACSALVTLVDLPDVQTPVFERLLADAQPDDSVLARAVYEGRPGHPVLIGRDWWDQAAELARGDKGARELFANRPHRLVECGDLASGEDVDLPPATTTHHPDI